MASFANQVQRTPKGIRPLNSHDLGMKVGKPNLATKPMGKVMHKNFAPHTPVFKSTANAHTMGTNIA